MTVVVGRGTEKKGEGTKKVFVGIRKDNSSRQLLNWALVKVAEPGDTVVAVHVCRHQDVNSKENPSLDDYLEVYKDLCHVKQVSLTGQIIWGTSARKILVREAKYWNVAAVVVGINLQNYLRGWFSMAKYCANRLPKTTAVLAIDNGKLVFEKGSGNQLPGFTGDPRPSMSLIQNADVPEIEKTCSQVVHSLKLRSRDSSRDSNTDDFNLEFNICVQSNKQGSRNSSRDSRVDNLSIGSPNSMSQLMIDLPDAKPGWPLLQRTLSMSQESPKDSEARKMTVVQWVMSLPNRSSSPKSQSQMGDDMNQTQNYFGRDISKHKISLSMSEELQRELELLLKTNSTSCRWFSHQELKNATSQFSSGNLIGMGGCSSVYKGCLQDDKHVAVKVMKSSKEVWKDFALEIDIASSLNHKHITTLIGLCIKDNFLIAVYDFLSKGSLEENLHGKASKTHMTHSVEDYKVRFNVAVGVAEALNYLHKDCPRPVIHRDVKSSNILLSDGLEPQLSDFGLAIWAPTTSSHATNNDLVGTFGYLSPEYFMYGKVSDKIDVYSYGVVLLELISGRKPIIAKTPKSQESLVMWANPLLESGDLNGLLDPNLTGKVDEVQMQRMVLAAALCLTRSSIRRPKMNEILKLLRGENDVEDWMNSLKSIPKESDDQDYDDDEIHPGSSTELHLSAALLNVDDDTSLSSMEQNSNESLED